MVAVRSLIICHWFVIEFWRQVAAGSVSRRCFSAWLQAERGAEDEHRAPRADPARRARDQRGLAF